MTPAQIKHLRHHLGETTAEFALRFFRSARTVEEWEQGRRRPDPMVLQGLRALADKAEKSSKKSKEST